MLAILVRLHRKRLDLSVIPELRYWSGNRLIKLIRILRIATVLRIGRQEKQIPDFSIQSTNDDIRLVFAKNTLKRHPVMTLDLQEEIKRQADAGYTLELDG